MPGRKSQWVFSSFGPIVLRCLVQGTWTTLDVQVIDAFCLLSPLCMGISTLAFQSFSALPKEQAT